jgi:hypothetical protein
MAAALDLYMPFRRKTLGGGNVGQSRPDSLWPNKPWQSRIAVLTRALSNSYNSRKAYSFSQNANA